MEQIIFHKLDKPYGEFNNFYECNMVVNNKLYVTVEHYYQSKKFEGTVYEEYIRYQSSPSKAKQIAYSEEAEKYFRTDWESVKLCIMATALYHKFKKESFKNLLMSTENKEIIEYSAKDSFWGQKNGIGENVLGKLLMELRARLHNQKVGEFII